MEPSETRILLRVVLGMMGLSLVFLAINVVPQSFVWFFEKLQGIDPAPDSAPVEPSPPAQPMDWSWLRDIGIAAAVIVSIVVVIGAVVAFKHHRRDVRAAAELAADTRAGQRERWAKGLAAYERAADALIGAETDPHTIFVRPLLLDTQEPATAAFHDAFAKADTLHVENVPHDDTSITEFVAAATAAERAFEAADDSARRKAKAGVTHADRRISSDETERLARARKLLTLALDPATEPEHARNCYTKIGELLDGIVTVPARIDQQMQRQIETVHRPALTSGRTTQNVAS